MNCSSNNKPAVSSTFKRCSYILIGLCFVLLLTWASPTIHQDWEALDKFIYLSFHEYFLGTARSIHFWAVMNSRIADNVSHIIVLLLFTQFLLYKKQFSLRRRIGVALFVIFALVGSILISKGGQHFLAKKRESPSLVYGHKIELSEEFPNLKNVKDSSHRSFPGDHAMTLFLATFFVFYFLGWKYGLISLVNMLLFMMPRLISGGHWITDIIMGAFPIAVGCWIFWVYVFNFLSSKKLKFSNN